MRMLNQSTLTQPHATRRLTVMQGESHISGEGHVVMTTILGSCIACCLFDVRAKIGGMNHFVLSLPPDSSPSDYGEAQRYGLYAMEVLVNEMLKAGAMRTYMRARLYGGANLHSGMRSIGTDNATFARNFLAADGIALTFADTGGTFARRLDFQPSTGRIRCKLVQEIVPETPKIPPKAACGEIELF
jgi:chemotaxis protein CheD